MTIIQQSHYYEQHIKFWQIHAKLVPYAAEIKGEYQGGFQRQR